MTIMFGPGIPQIEKHKLKERYMIPEGNPVSIDCSVTGARQYTVKWLAFKASNENEPSKNII